LLSRRLSAPRPRVIRQSQTKCLKEEGAGSGQKRKREEKASLQKSETKKKTEEEKGNWQWMRGSKRIGKAGREATKGSSQRSMALWGVWDSRQRGVSLAQKRGGEEKSLSPVQTTKKSGKKTTLARRGGQIWVNLRKKIEHPPVRGANAREKVGGSSGCQVESRSPSACKV